jgi:methyl-accepting chemotaxis protein
MGLGEQARGATEVARAMEDARKQTRETARGLSEQARAAKEIESCAGEVTRIAAEVARASVEQSTSAALMAKEGDEVRRIAKQSARAIAEQSDVLKGLHGTAARHTASLQRMVAATSEQAAETQELAQSMTHVRARMGELSSLARSAQPGRATPASANGSPPETERAPEEQT